EARAPVTWAAALPGAPGRLTRLGDILGADFRSAAIDVRAARDGVVLEGFAAAPSLTRANALGQYLFVNGRPVRDKLILGAVRAAYSDYLPRADRACAQGRPRPRGQAHRCEQRWRRGAGLVPAGIFAAPRSAGQLGLA